MEKNTEDENIFLFDLFLKQNCRFGIDYNENDIIHTFKYSQNLVIEYLNNSKNYELYKSDSFQNNILNLLQSNPVKFFDEAYSYIYFQRIISVIHNFESFKYICNIKNIDIDSDMQENYFNLLTLNDIIPKEEFMKCLNLLIDLNETNNIKMTGILLDRIICTHSLNENDIDLIGKKIPKFDNGMLLSKSIEDILNIDNMNVPIVEKILNYYPIENWKFKIYLGEYFDLNSEPYYNDSNFLNNDKLFDFFMTELIHFHKIPKNIIYELSNSSETYSLFISKLTRYNDDNLDYFFNINDMSVSLFGNKKNINNLNQYISSDEGISLLSNNVKLSNFNITISEHLSSFPHLESMDTELKIKNINKYLLFLSKLDFLDDNFKIKLREDISNNSLYIDTLECFIRNHIEMADSKTVDSIAFLQSNNEIDEKPKMKRKKF